MVDNLINLEMAYINTMHPEFRKENDVNLFFRLENYDEYDTGKFSFKF